MLFHTQHFFLFFVTVFALYWASPWQRVRIWLLVAASFYFYSSWNGRFAALIGGSAVVDFVLGRLLERTVSQWRRRLLLIFSIGWNLGQLCYFKYANFFIDSLDYALNAAGVSVSWPALNIILPIGISFYTFEAISYTVDVYRRDIPAERNLINFVLFITFFPRLIAGPIIRGRQFLPQVRRKKHWDWARLQLGANYFLLGLIKKMAIADRMAVFADPIFRDPVAHSSGAMWVGLFAYAIQIYCDFSGYSDMAVGLGHMLGYKLPQNFNLPYLARNIAEFWSRWHISLTSWLRDYLYIPLGGNFGPRWRASLNIVVTMMLCGLWHGANWTFVVFGLLHSLLLIAHRLFQGFCSRYPVISTALATRTGVVLRIALTFFIFTLTLVFFRSPNFHTAQMVGLRLLGALPGPLFSNSLAIFWSLVAIVLAGHLIANANVWNPLWRRASPLAYGCAYAVVLSLGLIFAPDGGRAFIYFQF